MACSARRGYRRAVRRYDALSAIPPYIALAGGDITATGDLDSLSAVDTFFGDGPLGADGETPVGGVFTGGGIDALAPNADSGGGYAALSALPVFFGSNNANTNFGPGVFTGGTGARRTVELRCAERYSGVPQSPAERCAGTAAAQQQAPLARAQNIAAAQASIEQPAPTTIDDADRRFQPGEDVRALPKLQALHPARTAGAHPAGTAAGGAGGDSGRQQWSAAEHLEGFGEVHSDRASAIHPLLLGERRPGCRQRHCAAAVRCLKKLGIGGGGGGVGQSSHQRNRAGSFRGPPDFRLRFPER